MTRKEQQIYEANLKLKNIEQEILADNSIILNDIEKPSINDCYIEDLDLKIYRDIEFTNHDFEKYPGVSFEVSGWLRYDGIISSYEDWADSGYKTFYKIEEVTNSILSCELDVTISIDNHSRTFYI